MYLTPNARLAYFLKKSHHKHNVFSFEDWVNALWSELKAEYPHLHLPKCLTALEREIIWEKIIDASQQGHSVFGLKTLVSLAIQAFDLTKAWRLDESDFTLKEEHASEFDSRPINLDTPMNFDIQWYQKCVMEYKALCEENHWIEHSSLLDFLIQFFKTNDFLVKELMLKKFFPKEITCVGFLELTPQQQGFLTFLKEFDIKIIHTNLLKQTGKVKTIAASNTEEECLMAASWAKNLIQHHQKTQVAIIVPELTRDRDLISKILALTLDPEEFNISAPKNLLDYPVFSAIFILLGLLKREFTIQEFSLYLRSPYIGHIGQIGHIGNSCEEHSERAMLDVAIHQRCESEYSLKRILPILKEAADSFNRTILSCINNLEALLTIQLPFYKKQRTKDWVLYFNQALEICAWQGLNALDDEQSNLKCQWEELLEELNQMDPFIQECNFTEALYHLQRLARNKVFLPKKEKASLQVLGVLEAQGIPFEAVWVMGLHSEVWPKVAAPNPFIPYTLQKKLQIPRCDAKRELAIAKKITDELCKSAEEIILSFPTMVEDEHVSASPLIDHFPRTSAESLGLIQKSSYLTKKLEIFKERHQASTHSKDIASTIISSVSVQPEKSQIVQQDEKGPALDDLFNGSENKNEKAVSPEPIIVPGGTQALKLQAICPFRAFAEIRLQAKPIPKPLLGLTLSERGEIIHQLLFRFWKEVKNQAQLNHFEDEALKLYLTSLIQPLLKFWQQKFPQRLQSGYMEIEKERVCELVFDFLNFEKQRSPFEVQSLEVLEKVKLGPLLFKIRIDRIDTLMDGREILMDYKTGTVALSNWFGERMDEPQLPFYALSREVKPSGLVFAVIKAATIEYIGLTEENAILPGVKNCEEAAKRYDCQDSLEEQYRSWQEAIIQLSKEFSQGLASVQPKDDLNSCRTCALPLFCRVAY